MAAQPAPGRRRPRRSRAIVTLSFATLLAGAPAGERAHALTTADVERAAAWATSGLRAVTGRLSADGYEGRDNDTPGSARAQRFLVARLRDVGPGLDAARPGDDAYRQAFDVDGVRGTNLLAIVPGRELPDEYVVVGAHYDHIGRRCDRSPGGRICNGAIDNATGVAAVLALGSALRRLPEPPRRSVVLALWDAEEDGLVGSRHYVAQPIVPLERTVAYVNFDMLGGRLLPSLARTSFAVAPETGGELLQGAVDAAIAAEGLGTRSLSYIFGQLRSDYASFVEGSVPTVFFSDSEGPCYHSTGDDLHLVDWDKLAAQSRIAFRVVVALAESPARPEFVPPNPALAVFSDAVALRDVFALGRRDLALFRGADRDRLLELDAQMHAIVADGPSAFDADDVGVVLGAAVEAIELIGRLECPKRDARGPWAGPASD
ncbi:MAG: M28 family peptidase [Thermodesulfobacteriota bacterium]